MNCWASQLGGCAGKQSREHIVSKGVFGSKRVEIKGFRWCADEFKTVAVARLWSNILCVGHNNALSPADAEAKRFKAELAERVKTPRATAGLEYISLDGQLFGRWLTKTYCNMRAADDLPLDDDFVRHSFGNSTRKQIRFYLFARAGIRFNMDTDHLGIRTFYGDNGEIILQMEFYGIPWVATNFDIQEMVGFLPFSGAPIVLGVDLVEQPHKIDFRVKGAHWIASIWWSRNQRAFPYSRAASRAKRARRHAKRRPRASR